MILGGRGGGVGHILVTRAHVPPTLSSHLGYPAQQGKWDVI